MSPTDLRISERNILARTLLDSAKIEGCILWRNHVGRGFMGTIVRRFRSAVGKFITLKDYRETKFGLCPGSFDLIGMFRGRFLAVECKRPGHKLTEAQSHFETIVKVNGGIAIVVDGYNQLAEKLPHPLPSEDR